MGVYKQGILGPFSGKVGQVVGANWRGIYYMRSLAPHVANPRTPGQVEQRTKLSVCVRTLRPWQEVLRYGYPGVNGDKGWSGAIRANLRKVSGDPGNPTLDFAQIAFTNSNIGARINLTVDAGQLTVTWDGQDSPEIRNDGKILIAFKTKTSTAVYITEEDISAGEKAITDTAFNEACEIVAFLYDSNNVTQAITEEYTP